jgi:Ca2+-binding RTX toxin-like protein
MATYNLSFSGLDSLLDRGVSPATENAIIEALKQSGDFGWGNGKIGVETQTSSGNFNVPSHDKLFLDLGASNHITLTTSGGTIIGAGDGSTTILDNGPGGDTLIGGAGAEQIQVKHGDNFLQAGAGENTLIGGAGHDTLIGGGSSLLEAGGGGSTLIGGLSDQSGNQGDSDGRHHHHDYDRHDHDYRDNDHRDHDHNGKNGDYPPGGQVPTDTLMGGSGADLLQVYHGDNVLIAGSGHDTLDGGDGQDTLYGGSGHDTINVAVGNDVIFGGTGHDTVNVGSTGNDVIYGGAATTVHVDQASTSIKHEVDVHGVTTITFTDHQVLTLSKVTIDFADGVHKTV